MHRPHLTAFAGLVLALASSAVSSASADDIEARQEYKLQTLRSRDPVLGGERDKIVVSVWIPSGVKVVRGAICNPFSKGDKVSGHWQAACRLWQFAYLQVDFDAVKQQEFELLFTGLTELAAKTSHPELEHVPLCFIGMSRGGGMSMQLAELHPERTIACAPVCLEVGPTSEATRKIPVVTVFGEKDGQQMRLLSEKLPIQRAESARWSIAVQWGRRHEFALANNLSFVLFDDAIAARLPAEIKAGEPVALRDIAVQDGWLGEVASWDKDGKRPAIAAYENYNGERAGACWFPSQRSAATWQAFVSASNEVKLVRPAGLGDGQEFVAHRAGEPISVALSIAGILKAPRVELWNGAERLAERISAPWEFEVRLPPGIHALYAVAHLDGQAERCSRPHTIVVAR
jgi:hypothetical protein